MSVAKTTRTVSQQGVKACKPAPVVVGRRAAAAGLLALGARAPKRRAGGPARQEQAVEHEPVESS